MPLGGRGLRASVVGSSATRTPMPVSVLPETDQRLSVPLVWVPPLTERLLRLLHDRGDWAAVDARNLEEIVAEIFAQFGYTVELTSRTRDGGRDVVAVRHSNIKEDKYLIECKHWQSRVDISVVRELLGVGQVEPNSGLILVSTSGFTKDAVVLSQREEVKWTLALRDREAIEAWIREYARQRNWLT